MAVIKLQRVWKNFDDLSSRAQQMLLNSWKQHPEEEYYEIEARSQFGIWFDKNGTNLVDASCRLADTEPSEWDKWVNKWRGHDGTKELIMRKYANDRIYRNAL